MPSLISKTKTDVIIVKAVEKPFKIKPTEPGGKIVDHQNLLIVDILKGSTKEADKPETLRPTAPNPEPPPVNVIMDIASETLDGVGIKRRPQVMKRKGSQLLYLTRQGNTQTKTKINS